MFNTSTGRKTDFEYRDIYQFVSSTSAFLKEFHTQIAVSHFEVWVACYPSYYVKGTDPSTLLLESSFSWREDQINLKVTP